MNTITKQPYPTETHLEEQWARLARRRYLENAPAQTSPQAMVLAGQPGAGKSVLAQAIQAASPPVEEAVVIDPQELLALHPAYAVLGEQDADPDCEFLRGATAQLAAELLIDAVNRRQHVLLHCAFEKASAAEAMFGYLRDHDYRVLVLVAAVDSQTSWQTVQARQGRPTDLPVAAPRISKLLHDSLYEGLLETLDRIETSSLVQELHLLSRQGQLLASMTEADGFVSGMCRAVYARMAPAANLPALSDAPVESLIRVPAANGVMQQRREWQRILRAAAEQRM